MLTEFSAVGINLSKAQWWGGGMEEEVVSSTVEW